MVGNHRGEYISRQLTIAWKVDIPQTSHPRIKSGRRSTGLFCATGVSDLCAPRNRWEQC
jgi:hypothetical protein